MIFSNCPKGLFIGQHYASRVTREHTVQGLHFALRGGGMSSGELVGLPERRFEVKIDHTF